MPQPKQDDIQNAAVSWYFELPTQAGYLIRRGGKTLSVAWSEVQPGLTIPQFSILLELDRDPGLDQRTIAERVWIDTSTIADTSQRLARNGYIERQRDPDDGRRYRLFITPAGREALAATLGRIPEVEERIMARLTPSERETFIRVLRKAFEQ